MRNLSKKGLEEINKLPLWDAAEDLRTEEEREAFLQEFKGENDLVMIDYAIGVIERSRRLWPDDSKIAAEACDED